jgi:N-acetylglucosaminyldiphosphoundecaprenol N-acetyl-beta-D-mannosaminyltransferase
MRKYFDILLEFNHLKLEEKIQTTSINNKGYCCFVDHTLLVRSFKERDNKLKNILNNALVNSCDGSYIAMMVNKIYRKQFIAYTGPDFFNKFIFKPDKQCIVGNTKEVFDKIKMKLESFGIDSSNLSYIPLPFLSVDKFDYKAIANEINLVDPRFIWVSLGAPKQEEFMFRILPNINKGVLLGVGAALNYFSGEVKDIPNWAKKSHLIWLYRVFTEPKKQIPRCINTFVNYPLIFITEYIKTKKII